jgi:hypothetical protein
VVEGDFEEVFVFLALFFGEVRILAVKPCLREFFAQMAWVSGDSAP